MDFKKEKLMMSEEEVKERTKELLNENQADLITKYIFLERQVKKQKEVVLSEIESLQQENKQLKNNRNKLKKWLEEETRQYWNTDILRKMQEQESDE